MNSLARVVRWATRPLVIDRDDAIGASERLSALTSLASSAEYLTLAEQMERGGPNDWSIHRDAYRGSHVITRTGLDAVSRPRTTHRLHQLRVALAASLLLPGRGRWRGVANLALVATGAGLYPRHRYGTDGSDQVAVQSQAAMGVARIARLPSVQDTMLWYLGGQATLSYAVSGWVKLLGPSWVEGSALTGIMRTVTYGHPTAHRLAARHPRATKRLVHGVLAMECLFPLVYAPGGRLVRPVLAATNAFHVSNGVLMGLGRFVTSFASMHPAVAYTSAPKRLMPHRDDRFLRTLSAGAVVAGGVAAAAAWNRRSVVRRGWPESRTFTTSRGNTLSYSLAAGEQDLPLVVLEPGLLSTHEVLGWISESLTARGRHGVLGYYRAGCGASERHATGEYSLEESVDDLVDLLRHVAGERRVVLVGHSLGGEIARRAAHRLGPDVSAVVYLDSSHPSELTRSQVQRESGEQLSRQLGSVATSLRLGMGMIMKAPDWVVDLPALYRRTVAAHFTDARLWTTALREWDATYRDFLAHDGPVADLPVPALVVSAGRTISEDPVQDELHEDLARSHRGADGPVRRITVDRAEHLSFVTDPRYVHQVTAALAEFLDELSAADAPALRGVPS